MPYITYSFLINHDRLLNEGKFAVSKGLIFDVFGIETTNLAPSDTFHPTSRRASFWRNSLETELHEIVVGEHRIDNFLKMKHTYILANMSDVASGYEKNFEYDEENGWYYDPKEICYTYWQEGKGLMAFSIIKNGQQEDYICTKMEENPPKTEVKEKELSNKTPLKGVENEKSITIINAVLIGIAIGIVIYSVVKNKLGFFSLIPLFLVFKMYHKSKQKSD